MPLHDAVGINSKKGATIENQGSAVKYMPKGCILMTVCVFYRTWHDYPSFLYGKRHGIYIYIYIYIYISV